MAKVTIVDYQKVPSLAPGAAEENTFWVRYKDESGKLHLVTIKAKELTPEIVKKKILEEESKRLKIEGMEIDIPESQPTF